MANNQRLNPHKETPISGVRKERLEALRKNNVPRYLFRAWYGESGGAPSATLNTSTAIVPHLFMPAAGSEYDGKRQDFYELPESMLYEMATNHYHGVTTSLSGFSSWVASLHLVLCYAKYMKRQNMREPYVSVMDTHKLESEVLVWHVPHLGIAGNHEYLAFGRILGTGYQAVSLRKLESHGIDHLFTKMELKDCGHDMFGHALRRSMHRHGQHTWTDLRSLVPSLATCLSPSPQLWPAFGLGYGGPGESHMENIELFARKLKIDHAPPGLHEEPWLAVDMVDTIGFPDVQQWIDLMAMFAQLLPQQQPLQPQLEQTAGAHAAGPEETAAASAEEAGAMHKGRKRKKGELEEDERPAKSTAMTLRKRINSTHKPCRGAKCGRCMACRAA